MSIINFINFEKEILALKKQKHAVILSHYFQDSEVQDISDFVGNSEEIIKKAISACEKNVIIAAPRSVLEIAYCLNPSNTYLIPDINSGCSLENSVKVSKILDLKTKYPNSVVVSHINSGLEILEISDYIVTTSNAENIVSEIDDQKTIIFTPDKNLGKFLKKRTNKDIITMSGVCQVHNNFSERELIKLKSVHRKAKVIASPLCNENILNYADFIGSGSQLIKYIESNVAGDYITAFEPGIIYYLQKKFNNLSKFYDVPSISANGHTTCSICKFMKLTTLEKIYKSLKNNSTKITIDNQKADIIKNHINITIN